MGKSSSSMLFLCHFQSLEKKTSIYKSPAYRQYLLLSYEINIKKCNQHQSYLHPKTHKKKKSVGVYNNNRISCDYYCVIISHSLSFIHSLTFNDNNIVLFYFF